MSAVDPVCQMYEALGEANSAHDLGMTEARARKKLRELFPNVDVDRIIENRGLPDNPLGFAEEPTGETADATGTTEPTMSDRIRARVSRRVEVGEGESVNDAISRAAGRQP